MRGRAHAARAIRSLGDCDKGSAGPLPGGELTCVPPGRSSTRLPRPSFLRDAQISMRYAQVRASGWPGASIRCVDADFVDSLLLGVDVGRVRLPLITRAGRR